MHIFYQAILCHLKHTLMCNCGTQIEIAECNKDTFHICDISINVSLVILILIYYFVSLIDSIQAIIALQQPECGIPIELCITRIAKVFRRQLPFA